MSGPIRQGSTGTGTGLQLLRTDRRMVPVVDVREGCEGDKVTSHREFVDANGRRNIRVRICERAIEELELTRAELQLNPTVDVAVQSALIRIEHARQGERHALTHPGRLPW